jgi:hypothetical protein
MEFWGLKKNHDRMIWHFELQIIYKFLFKGVVWISINFWYLYLFNYTFNYIIFLYIRNCIGLINLQR